MVADGVLVEIEEGGKKLYTISQAARENFNKAIEELQTLIRRLT
jgi:DNA-binding PadR family transcriptional regulator